MPDGRSVGAGLVVTGAALALWGFGDRDADDTHTIDETISVVQLDTRSGNVRIETGDVQATTVREHRSYWLVKNGDAFERDGEKLKLKGDCGWQCEADFVVTVPRGTKVTGESGSGDVEVHGAGDIDVEIGSGNATVKDATGAVSIDVASGDVTVDGVARSTDLRSRSGDVKATGLKGSPVRGEANSGSVELDLDTAGSVVAESRSGDVTVKVPTGSYQVDAQTRSGDSKIGIPTDPNGTHSLKLSTNSGDVGVSIG